MSEHEHTIGEAIDAAMESIERRRGLVTIDADGFVSLRTGHGTAPYEFELNDMGDALRWIEHIAEKSWCTTTHLQLLAKLAADRFGARYR